MAEMIHPLDRQTHDHLVVAEFREGQAPAIHVVPETRFEQVTAMNGHVLASTPLVSLRVALEMSELLSQASPPAADFAHAQEYMRRRFKLALEDARCDGN